MPILQIMNENNRVVLDMMFSRPGDVGALRHVQICA